MHYTKIISLLLITALISCNKYLEKKPDKALVVPATLKDIQAILDNELKMNHSSPDLLEALADNYYVTTSNFEMQPLQDRQNYVWDRDAMSLISWQTPYQGPIYYANVALDQLATITTDDQTLKGTLTGSALFYRGYAFYQLAQLYCGPYSSSSLPNPGIPLRITSAIETPSIRSTVSQTYQQILSDLKTAIPLLPDSAEVLTRPSKTAAYAALARTYLSMRNYDSAFYYADISLSRDSLLIDFNTLPSSSLPIKRFNIETIFYNLCEPYNGMPYGGTGYIDTVLYKSYQDNDLRKTVFFKANTGTASGTYRFKGSFDSQYYPQLVFDGLTTGEMWLIRAECAARKGRMAAALKDLNTLLYHRWKNNGSWASLSAETSEQAVMLILSERRKELVYRGLRWTDLRRLNLEGAGITLTRVVGGLPYTLPPDDPRWVLLIPQEVIDHSEMPQNPR